MLSLNQFKNLLWDFDGVLIDSMPIRNKGFELVFWRIIVPLRLKN
jgi:beta-phosphoglucomutase-like phosphatase (HAD superfamily)